MVPAPFEVARGTAEGGAVAPGMRGRFGEPRRAAGPADSFGILPSPPGNVSNRWRRKTDRGESVAPMDGTGVSPPHGRGKAAVNTN